MAKTKAKTKVTWWKLIAAIGFCQIAGIIGSVFTSPNIASWYATLQRPAFSPPNWVFAPVWLSLYTLMGISLYLVWTSSAKTKAKMPAYYVFAIQLALNAIWSILFFGLQSPLYGLICIIPLWISILATLILFYKISKVSAYLLVPYLIWVTTATALNYSIWVLN